MTIETVETIPMKYNHVIAFEVSKAEIHVHSRPGGTLSIIPNKAGDIRRLIKKEMSRNPNLGIGPLLVLCEATGSYDRLVTNCAAELGVACHRAHGSRVRAFAQYRGLKAKTDASDAPLLSDFGCDSENLRLHTPPSPEQVELRELVERRTELREMKEAEYTDEKGQKAHVIDKVAMVFGQMNEPPGNRLRVALTGLTMAERFRDDGLCAMEMVGTSG